jgi:hypothetical protein
MKLTDLVKKIISEDATGNFPASGGGMSPSRSPTAVSPTPTPVDIIKSYENFKKGLEQQKIYAVNKFSEELKKQFLKNPAINVRVKASKGSADQQVQKEYNISVNNIDVRYMNDKYHVVFIGKEGNKSKYNDYYLEDSFIQIDGSAPANSGTDTTGGLDATSQTSTGNTNRNIVPQT